MLESVGHQTIEKTAESVSQRLKEGPVKSTILDDEGKFKEKPPFAGDGYYFWEDNIEAAEWWGNVHYKKNGLDFRIFRIDLKLRYTDNSFLDLVGSRRHLRLLGRLIRKARMSIDCSEWALHSFITYFRIQEKRQNGMFPYKMIRFNDSGMNPKIQSAISLSKYQNVTLLNPFYIVCVFEKEDLLLNTYLFIK